jgi:uncharacterized phage protein (TIGR02216 family)
MSFPFKHAMAFGLGVLRLSSRDFWTMTPHELLRAAEGHFGSPMDDIAPATLRALLNAHPDRK